MKVFYLTGSIISTVLILILAFENISSQCTSLNFFFYAVDSSPTIIFLGIAVLGIITGIFYHAFLNHYMAPTDDDSEENL